MVSKMEIILIFRYIYQLVFRRHNFDADTFVSTWVTFLFKFPHISSGYFVSVAGLIDIVPFEDVGQHGGVFDDVCFSAAVTSFL